MSGLEKIFWLFAVLGTGFFLLRVIVAIVGGFGADLADSAETGAGAPESAHAPNLEGTDPAFKLVSINSVTGFFMMFGWGGLAALKEYGWGPVGAAAAGTVAGGLTMAATAFLFRAAMKLVSAGDRFDAAKTAGARGTVYLRIPGDGRGKVQFSHNNASRILEAVSEEGADLESFTEVVIVKAIDGSTVSVRKA